jgi:uncharacterized phage protein (TIGR01671 family)
MRDMKFRAWSPSLGEFVNSTDGDARFFFYEGEAQVHRFEEYWREEGGELECKNRWIHVEDAIIQQCAGLKDKNGVDIYEGDMVWHKDTDEPCVIEFEKETAMFLAREVQGERLGFCMRYVLEVAGNIYESA